MSFYAWQVGASGPSVSQALGGASYELGQVPSFTVTAEGLTYSSYSAANANSLSSGVANANSRLGYAVRTALNQAQAIGRSPAGRVALGFARSGGPQGLLLGALLAYAAYYLAHRGDGGTRHHPGFTLVNQCNGQGPEARLQEGSPHPCLSLIATGGFEVALDAPYSVGERVTGFTEIWLSAPFVGRWSSTSTWAPDAVNPAKAGDQPVVLPEDDPFSPYRDDGRRDFRDPRKRAVARDLVPPLMRPRQHARSRFDDDDIDQKAVVPPEVDPMGKPIGWFHPRAIILPWRVVAARDDAGNPRRVHPETSVAGYDLPRDVSPSRPIPVHPNAVVPTVVVTPRGTTIEPARPRIRAGARTHEVKFRVSPNGPFGEAWKKLFGQVTEAGDLIDAMYGALPKSIRLEDWRENGGHKLSRAHKLESLYDNYNHIDLNKMASNIVFQQLQDTLIGKASGDITAMTGGSPIARTLGAIGKLGG